MAWYSCIIQFSCYNTQTIESIKSHVHTQIQVWYSAYHVMAAAVPEALIWFNLVCVYGSLYWFHGFVFPVKGRNNGFPSWSVSYAVGDWKVSYSIMWFAFGVWYLCENGIFCMVVLYQRYIMTARKADIIGLKLQCCNL